MDAWRSPFGRLITAQGLAQAADGVAQAALADVLLLEPLAQDTPERVLRLFLVTLLPYSLLSPFMGVLVDRWSRKRIMVGSSAARAVAIGSLAMFPASLDSEPVLLIAALTVLGFGRLFLTTKGAVLPLVAGGRDLVSANSVSAGAGMVSALAGGMVGIGVAGWADARAALLAALVVYGAAAVAAARVELPVRTHVHHRVSQAVVEVTRDLIAGIRRVLGHSRTALPIGAIFFVRSITMFGAFASLLAIKEQFALRAERGGLLSLVALALAAAGIGAFLGAATGAWVKSRLPRARLLVAGFGVVAASTLVLAAWRNPAALLAAFFMGGYGAFLTKVAVDALLQEAVGDHFRGRAFALYDIAYNLASIVAGIVLVATATSSPGLILAAAGGLTIVAGAALSIAVGGSGRDPTL